MRTVIILLTTLLLITPMALRAEQPHHAEAKRLVGKVNIERAVVFNANRASYQKTCGHTYRYEGLASVVGRLEYGALTTEEQALFKTMLEAQARSNNAVFASAANEGARRQFCVGMENYISDYVSAFAKAHPELFTKKE